MERFTVKLADGTYAAADGCSSDEIVQKLAKFENMYDTLCREHDKVIADMEKLRLAGKSKTVTYKQLLANKMMIMELISRFDIYGL
ncbi:MAG: hypothetical protein ACM3NT_05920 [Methylocystaceae bacterium]